jgi:hypothetical protein
MKRGVPRSVRSPQELDAEEQKVDVMSPGVSEASTVSEGRSRQGSWGGELDGSGRDYIVRGHRDEV